MGNHGPRSRSTHNRKGLVGRIENGDFKEHSYRWVIGWPLNEIIAMASDRQIAANRRNANRSTGPRTSSGKLQSRGNAYRHGLTAETVIASLEDINDYRMLEASVYEDYAPNTVIEHELVGRLASLLWRLRRATLIESGMFEMQGSALLQDRRDEFAHQARNPSLATLYQILNHPENASTDTAERNPPKAVSEHANHRKLDAGSAYIKIFRMHPGAMKNLGRYEMALWRQLAQTLLLLEAAGRNRWARFRG